MNFRNLLDKVQEKATNKKRQKELERKKSLKILSVSLCVLMGIVGIGAISESRSESSENTSRFESVQQTEMQESYEEPEFQTTSQQEMDQTSVQESSKESSSSTTESSVSQIIENIRLTTDAANFFKLSSIPKFSGQAYIAVNQNVPYFHLDLLPQTSYESYSDLDSMGRCGTAHACIGKDLMPTEERGSIGMVKPVGWHTVKYDCVDGKYLYNRCHLIGFQLTGENANESNLMTGTRYMNVQGMLPFENMAADYIKETGNHVAYRVTPIYEGDNLLSAGVLMEGYSIEDQGAGVCFNVFAYNAQPSVGIDYATGNSWLLEAPEPESTEPSQEPVPGSSEPVPQPAPESSEPAPEPQGETYILNTNTKKFHRPDCSSVKQMSEKNKKEFTGSRDEVINWGYVPCKRCCP